MQLMFRVSMIDALCFNLEGFDSKKDLEPLFVFMDVPWLRG